MSKETSSVSTCRYHKEGQYNTIIGVEKTNVKIYRCVKGDID